MTDTPANASPGIVSLAMKQVPMILRSFCRQNGMMLWNYGFSLLVLFVACSLLAPNELLRPFIASAIIVVTLVSGGLFGTSRGMWMFFGGSGAERYWTSASAGSSLAAYCISRFILTASAAVVQLLALGIVYRVDILHPLLPLLLISVLASACFVALGAFCASITGSRRGTAIVANILFVLLIVFSGAVLPVKHLPAWAGLMPSAQAMTSFDGLLSAAAGGGEIATRALGLVLATVVFGAVAAMKFDWLAFDRGMAEDWDV